jgi:hypothetical protein
MDESIYAACRILERTTESDKFEYIEAYGGNWRWIDDDDRRYLIEYYDVKTKKYDWVEVNASSKTEAVGQFCIDHPNIPYADIDVYLY